MRFGSTHCSVLFTTDTLWASPCVPPGSYPPSRSREIATLAHMAPIVPWVLPKVRSVLRAQKVKDAGHTHDPTSTSARSV